MNRYVNKTKYVSIYTLFIIGFIAWIVIALRTQSSPSYHLITIDKAANDRKGWSLREIALPSRQSVVLHTFPPDTQPLFVTFAPREQRIGILASREDRVEFNLLDLYGRLLNRISISPIEESITRPYYRNGQFLFSTPNSLLSVTAKDGVLSQKDIRGKIPPAIYEVLTNHPRTFVPTEDRLSYTFCYGHEVRTPRVGALGYHIFPPITGHMYTYSVPEEKVSGTSISAIDLMPSHRSQVAVYTSIRRPGCDIKILTPTNTLVSQFTIPHQFSSLRWSPSDTQMFGWDQQTFTCYSLPTGKTLYRMQMEASVQDWDCVREWQVFHGVAK